MKLLPSTFFAAALGEIPTIVTKDDIHKYAKSWNMQVDKTHSSSYEIIGKCQKIINWSSLMWQNEAEKREAKLLVTMSIIYSYYAELRLVLLASLRSAPLS